jgi:hypothetical protein
MWWLLPYAAYTLLGSAVAGVASYAAVTRFSIAQKLLKMAVERALNMLAASDDDAPPTYHVHHTQTGAPKMGARRRRANAPGSVPCMSSDNLV